MLEAYVEMYSVDEEQSELFVEGATAIIEYLRDHYDHCKGGEILFYRKSEGIDYFQLSKMWDQRVDENKLKEGDLIYNTLNLLLDTVVILKETIGWNPDTVVKSVMLN
jgi:hypothetical protein